MPHLEIKDASKRYGSQQILSGINLEIGKGEFVAIIGYSGAGKTTLISMIAGLVKPDSGTVKLDGEIVTGPGPDRGLVFQNYSLLPWLTVYENVALAVDEVFAKWTAAQRREHTEKFIDMVKLTPARDKRPAELSGGMRQRVAVARTLATNPKVLLLDEPLSALDALTRANLQDEITSIRRQDDTTIVLITNDPDEAILLADRVIPLTAGPAATLGPSIPVTLSRPRDRKAVNHCREFKLIRNEVISFLLKSRQTTHAHLSKRLVLPDIEPEDISRGRPTFTFGYRPVRRSEIKVVTVPEEIQS
jgi:nitrate/nitrite transport system ATP-binding protein